MLFLYLAYQARYEFGHDAYGFYELYLNNLHAYLNVLTIMIFVYSLVRIKPYFNNMTIIRMQDDIVYIYVKNMLRDSIYIFLHIYAMIILSGWIMYGVTYTGALFVNGCKLYIFIVYYIIMQENIYLLCKRSNMASLIVTAINFVLLATWYMIKYTFLTVYDAQVTEDIFNSGFLIFETVVIWVGMTTLAMKLRYKSNDFI